MSLLCLVPKRVCIGEAPFIPSKALGKTHLIVDGDLLSFCGVRLGARREPFNGRTHGHHFRLCKHCLRTYEKYKKLNQKLEKLLG